MTAESTVIKGWGGKLASRVDPQRELLLPPHL